MNKERLKGAVEAILFSAGDSVELSRIAKALELDKETTQQLIREMMDSFEQEDRGIKIIELEQSYQMCTKQEYYDYLVKMAMEPKKAVLTDVMLETLSIIAYKIRGVKCDHAVNKLMEYGLVQELGRLDAPGKPILFGTTEEFLRTFGVESSEELPVIDPVQMEDFKAEAEEEIDFNMSSSS